MRRWTAIGAGVALAVVAALFWFSRGEEVAKATLAGVSPERARPARAARPPIPTRVPRPEPEPEPEPESGATEVRCAVGDALAGWPVRVFDLDDGQPIDWRIEEGALVFEAEGPTGQVGLTWGFLRRREDSAKSFAKVSWSAPAEGATTPTCAIDHLPAPLDAAIYGRVRGAERLPEGTVFLEGCGLQERGEPAPIDVDGGFFLQAQEGRCSLRAWRRAGMLRIPGPWIEVDASAADDAEVDLEVPTFEPAGMGIGFQPVDEGVAVNQVHEGTPAAAAGLEPGDVITSIDGVDTSGMDVEDFLLHGIGPAGTDVAVSGVGVDGEPFEVVVRRALIQ